MDLLAAGDYCAHKQAIPAKDYRELTSGVRHALLHAHRDAPATPAEKARLQKLSPAAVQSRTWPAIPAPRQRACRPSGTGTRMNEAPRRPIEVHMNEFITPPWVEKPRLSPARELAGESILT